MSYPVSPGPVPPQAGHSLRRPNLRAILACSIAALAGVPAMAQSLTWDTNPSTAGAQPGSGSWSGPLAWLNGSTNQAWVNGADAILIAPPSSNFAIDVGNVTLDDLSASGAYLLQNGTLTFAGGEGAHEISDIVTISATIAGSDGITITGRSVTLSGTNTYSGTTTIRPIAGDAGTGRLFISGGNAIPDTSNVSMLFGASLVVNQSETVGNLDSPGSSIQIADGAVLTIGANGGTADFLGAIGGAGGLTKVGAGTSRITNNLGSYSGDTTVNEGTLVLIGMGPSSQQTAIHPSSKVTIAAGATLQFGQFVTIGGLMGEGDLAMNNNSLVLNAATGTFSGKITGSGGQSGEFILIRPSSDVTFTGASSFNKDLRLEGTLRVNSVADSSINSPIGADGAVRLFGGKFVFTGAGLHSTNRLFVFGSSGTSTVEVAAGATLATSQVGGTGTLRKAGSGTLRLVGNQDPALRMQVDEGVLAFENSSFMRIGGLSGNGTVDLMSGTLGIKSVGTFVHSGVIQGLGSLVIEESITPTNTSRLEGANTFSGGLTINANGTLIVSDFNLAGTPGPLGTGAVTVNGSLLHAGQTDVTSNRAFHVGDLGARFGMTTQRTLTLGGLLSGSGGVTAVGAGSALRLTNPANSFTGPVIAGTGTLRVDDIPMSGVNSPIGAGNKVAIANNGVLLFTGVGNFVSDRSVELTGNATVQVADSGTSLRPGRVTGAGSLIKKGAGRLILTDPTNDFMGIVGVQEGVLVTGPLADSGSPSGIGKGPAIFLGGELRLSEGAGGTTNRTLLMGDSGGGMRISNSSVTLNGNFQGAGSLTLAGNGAVSSTFILNSANHGFTVHSGAMVIESATVRTAGEGSIGRTNRAVLTENLGGVLQIDAPETIGSLHGGGGSNFGRVVLNAALTTGNDGSNSAFDGVIEGVGTLTKIGQGILALTGANTFTGALLVGNGVVAFPSSLGNGTSPLGATSNHVILENDGQLRYTGSGVTSVSQSLLIRHGFSNARPTVDVPNSSSTLVWAGSVNGNISVPLQKEGVGTLRLSGANGFTGDTNINAGKLQVIGSNALPNEGTVTVAAGAALELLPGTNEAIGALEGAGNLILGGQKLTLGGANDSMTFSGVISGGGASQLEKTGSGTLTLSNLNSSFTGGVNIVDGAISVPSVANIGVNSPLGSNGPIILGDASHTGRLIVTSINPGATNRPIVLTSGGAAVEVTDPEAEFELGGSISGPGSLLKLGAGKLKLGSPTGGPIVVAAGTLTLNTDISGAAGATTLIAPGILDTPVGVPHGVGQLNVVSGTVAPGGVEGIGMLTAEGIMFESGIFDVDLQGTSPSQHDSLHVNGVATFNGEVELAIGLSFDPVDYTDVFRIVVTDGNDPITFNGSNARFAYRGNLLEDGEHFLVNDGGFSQHFWVEYGEAGDNDIQLFAAPEPGAATLLLTAGMGLFARRRRSAR
jgi:fibronectin-binding autotransporter adhesin